MDKPQHPLGEIVDRLRHCGDHCVRLTPAMKPCRDDTRTPDAASLVRRALENPLDFPALSAGTVPGDRVAIAIGDGVPRAGEVARAVLEAFLATGIDHEAVSIVTADSVTARSCRDAIEMHTARLPQFVMHDADDKDNLCLVGLNRRKEPVLVNRSVFEADVVLPIGCARAGGGAFDCLFPSFSSAEAIARFHTPANVCSPTDIAKCTKEADEAGWLIGVLMAMLVVPGPDGAVAHVVAGEPDAVARQADLLYRQQWSRLSPRQVDLVIATISGGAETQNWWNVGRALASAEPLLDEGGAVVICSNLDQPPGESLCRLIGSDDLEKTQRRIFRDHALDSLPAWHAARALQRGPVYLLSRLDSDTVEDLGLAPVDNIDEVVRLAGRHESYAVIDDSQHTFVSLE